MNDQQRSDASENMATLSEVMNLAATRGYTAELKVTDKGLCAMGHDRYYQPGETHIDNFYRFEGESNPDDMSILYLIETEDGTKGTLVDAYGTYASSIITNFIMAVENMHKEEPGE